MNYQKAIDIIQKNLEDVLYIYVFGSHAQKMNVQDSDIDVAFFSGKSMDSVLVYKTAQEIASAYNVDVDLVDLSKAGDVLKMEVICKGDPVYFTSENDRKLFESRIIEDYMDYKELIHSIEKEIKTSGKIYN